MAEMHLTTRLTDNDTVFLDDLALYTPEGAGADTVVNLTGALHANLNRTTTLRVGGVFPITGGNTDYGRTDRFFDSEIIVQLNRFF